MVERFEEMVLNGVAILKTEVGKLGVRPAMWTVELVCEAQHAADMSHEIACPHTEETDWHGLDCLVCHGTGRVTLGGIVAADRARKVVPP